MKQRKALAWFFLLNLVIWSAFWFNAWTQDFYPFVQVVLLVGGTTTFSICFALTWELLTSRELSR